MIVNESVYVYSLFLVDYGGDDVTGGAQTSTSPAHLLTRMVTT